MFSWNSLHFDMGKGTLQGTVERGWPLDQQPTMGCASAFGVERPARREDYRSGGHVKDDNPVSRSRPPVPLYPRRPKMWRQALRDSVEHEFMYLRFAHTCAVGAH